MECSAISPGSLQAELSKKYKVNEAGEPTHTLEGVELDGKVGCSRAICSHIMPSTCTHACSEALGPPAHASDMYA